MPNISVLLQPTQLSNRRTVLLEQQRLTGLRGTACLKTYVLGGRQQGGVGSKLTQNTLDPTIRAT